MKKLLKIMSAIAIIAAIVFCTTTVQAASKSKKLPTPKSVKVSISGTSNVKVSWAKTNKAKKYTIYRATTKSGKYKKVGTTKTTSYTDKKTSRGKTYYYKVVANAAKSKEDSKKTAAVKVTVPSKAKALKEIKKALKDSKWVNKNLKLKESVFGEDASKYKQSLTFTKIKGKELVVIQNYCENALTIQGYVVGYTNGKVMVKAISKYPMHAGHSGMGVDSKNAILSTGSLHMGYMSDIYYKISDVKFTKKASFYTNEAALETPVIHEVNGKKVSKSKYNKELKKYTKYNTKAVTTKLTAKNIDKYIK